MTVTKMIIIAQNDRYPSRKWPLVDNTTKMTVMHQIRKITVILVLNNKNDRYTKSEIIGHLAENNKNDLYSSN